MIKVQEYRPQPFIDFTKQENIDAYQAALTKVRAELVGKQMGLAQRLAERSGHFFPTSLLDSQFQTLQPLQEDEPGFTVDIRETVEQEVQDILDTLPDFLLRLAERRA